MAPRNNKTILNLYTSSNRQSRHNRDFKDAYHYCLFDDGEFFRGPSVDLMPVGKLRHLKNAFQGIQEYENDHVSYYQGHKDHVFRDNGGPYRVNAVKAIDG